MYIEKERKKKKTKRGAAALVTTVTTATSGASQHAKKKILFLKPLSQFFLPCSFAPLRLQLREFFFFLKIHAPSAPKNLNLLYIYIYMYVRRMDWKKNIAYSKFHKTADQKIKKKGKGGN